MAVIVRQEQIAADVFRLTLAGVPIGSAGQFVMVRLPDASMLLPRPISLFDADGATGETTLVYRVAGRGTKLLSTLETGALDVSAPRGAGYPILPGPAVLIGGGLGVAPLHLLAKQLREADPGRSIRIFLGFSAAPFLLPEFSALSESVTPVQGGYVTDHVDFAEDATFYACGPEPMMQAAAKRAAASGRTLYVSLERRMACGVGACYGCSIRTKSGNRRVCKDGPVFLSSEVYDG